MHRLGSAHMGFVVAAILTFSTSLAEDTSTAAANSSVWQKHQYSFAFLGFTSTYSCDGLASKLKLLLIASGARADAKAQAGACSGGFGRPDKFARADLTFYTLAPASEKHEDGKPIDGYWLPVAIADRQPLELGRGDCELVEQFRSNLLPMFSTRNVENHTTCIPHQDSGSVIDLRFDSLRLRPAAAAKPS